MPRRDLGSGVRVGLRVHGLGISLDLFFGLGLRDTVSRFGTRYSGVLGGSLVVASRYKTSRIHSSKLRCCRFFYRLSWDEVSCPKLQKLLSS